MPRAKSIAARRSNRTREKNSVCFCLCCSFSFRTRKSPSTWNFLIEKRPRPAQLHFCTSRKLLSSLLHTQHIYPIQFGWFIFEPKSKSEQQQKPTSEKKFRSKEKRRGKKEIFQPTDKYTTDYMKMKRNICMSQVSLFARTGCLCCCCSLAMVFACLALVVCARLWAQFDRGKL